MHGLDIANIRLFTHRQLSFLGFLFLLAPLFEPASFSHIPSLAPLSTLYTLGKVVAVIVIITMFARKGSFSPFNAAMILLSASIFCSTLINEGNLFVWVSTWGSYLSLVLLLSVALKSQHNEFFWAVFVLTTALSAVNLFSIIAFPEGVYSDGLLVNSKGDYFFWGQRNESIKIIIPSVLSSMILDYYAGKAISMRSVFALSVGVLECVVGYSATSTVALTLLVIGVAFVRFKPLRSILNSYTFMGIFLIGTISIVHFRITDVFASFLGDVLGRSATLTGRTIVWDLVSSLMDSTHTAFGYGVSGNQFLVFSNGLSHYAHAHDELLNIWFMGGIVALIIYLALIALASKPLFSMRKDRLASLIAVFLGCFYIVGFTEMISSLAFFFSLGIASNYGNICRKADYRREDFGLVGVMRDGQ